ncbi:MAG: pyridoxal phosphate-dependent aminotransferase, partial [Clostridia bacterium]|nr:pyridoxal phosphate-dependent aminotransferase [Clostridia bacterium]
ALDKGFTKYTAAAGMIELKTVIKEKLERDNGLKYETNEILVSAGAKSSLYYAMLAVLDPGDEVIVPTPIWLTYPELVKMCGCKPVFVNTKPYGFKLTAKSFAEAVTEKTKMLILNTPCNPTGVVYSREELTELAKVAVEKDVYVLSDEIYEKLVYGVEHVSIAALGEDIKKRTIVVNGMSKSYSMTGWRVGYTAADKDIIKAMTNIQSHAAGNTCSIAQYASIKAIKDGEQFSTDARNIFAARRLLLIEFAKRLPKVTFALPQGAFYLFMDVSAYYGKSYNGRVINGSLDFAECLLNEGVALIPGAPFGDDKSVRLSYAVAENDIVKGFERISAFLSKLK